MTSPHSITAEELARRLVALDAPAEDDAEAVAAAAGRCRRVSASLSMVRYAANGVAAILTALIALLGRLIGPDIAMRLVEQSVPMDAASDARATGEEGKQ